MYTIRKGGMIPLGRLGTDPDGDFSVLIEDLRELGVEDPSSLELNGSKEPGSSVYFDPSLGQIDILDKPLSPGFYPDILFRDPIAAFSDLRRWGISPSTSDFPSHFLKTLDRQTLIECHRKLESLTLREITFGCLETLRVLRREVLKALGLSHVDKPSIIRFMVALPKEYQPMDHGFIDKTHRDRSNPYVFANVLETTNTQELVRILSERASFHGVSLRWDGPETLVSGSMVAISRTYPVTHKVFRAFGIREGRSTMNSPESAPPFLFDIPIPGHTMDSVSDNSWMPPETLHRGVEAFLQWPAWNFSYFTFYLQEFFERLALFGPLSEYWIEDIPGHLLPRSRLENAESLASCGWPIPLSVFQDSKKDSSLLEKVVSDAEFLDLLDSLPQGRADHLFYNSGGGRVCFR